MPLPAIIYNIAYSVWILWETTKMIQRTSEWPNENYRQQQQQKHKIILEMSHTERIHSNSVTIDREYNNSL